MPRTNRHNSWKIPFIAGLIFGFSSAISLKTNVSLDQEYYLRLILSNVCEVTNTTFPKGTSWTKPNCGSYLMWFDILTVLVFIITIIAAICATGKIIEGIILYLLGALIGFALIFFFVH